MKLKRALLFTFSFFLLFSCSPKNPGFITLVNSGVETLKISIDGRSFTVRPTNHITKEIEAGMHQIKFDGSVPTLLNVQKGLTTVFDSTGLSCFVVADYTEAYKGGPVKIVERSFHKRTFTTQDTMSSVLGAPLPERPKEGERVLRIQQIDCEIVDDDAALTNELSAYHE